MVLRRYTDGIKLVPLLHRPRRMLFPRNVNPDTSAN
jgi:hypothetical protein